MPVTVQMRGLEDLRLLLSRLPIELVDDADAIISDEAEKAQSEIAAGYPATTKLRAGLTTVDESQRAKGIVHYRLFNKRYEAVLYEYGTQVRHQFGQYRGAMPTHPNFVPVAERHRRSTFARLVALVQSKGLSANANELM